MKKNNYIFRLFSFIILGTMLTGCVSGSSFIRPGTNFSTIGKIAVISKNKQLNKAQNHQIADLFTLELLKKGYDVVDRANLDETISEALFQTESGVSDTNNQVKIGIKNIQVAVIVNIADFTNSVSMSAKMVEIATGKILWIGEGKGWFRSNSSIFLGSILESRVARGGGVGYNNGNTGLIIESADERVIGGVVSSTTEILLEGNQREVVQKVIKKVIQKLPNLIS